MRFSQLLDDSFQLFVGFEQGFIHGVYIFTQLKDFQLRLVSQFICHLQALFPSLDAVNDFFNSIVNLGIFLPPMLHFLELNLYRAVTILGL